MIQEFYVSTDKTKLDAAVIVDFLQHKSYWAKTRSKQTIETSLANSFCFGVFTQENQQVGFARVITDFAVFAWLLDVFILQEYRGKGLGKLLVQTVMASAALSPILLLGSQPYCCRIGSTLH